ncbi:hypothetical protein GCM10011360_17980 [Primorskyibacter flagellatus]|uniref:Uncharacterized protein n=1 Tax=Primorskyibacter flagellatus TaxID=1387277 RepID=A0A917A6S3_9RHOB|nr:hypothetical protein [Primorskyibacter flagellatus]GGE30366.1 hypothetical protein GCM10011360_17980 [Primorskyibacter flagellatus]
MTITLYWWMLPLAITIIAFIPASLHQQRGDYDFGGAILGFIGLVATAVAWIVAIIMRLAQ